MDYFSLLCYITVCDSLNFTKAADKLYITQPALSRKIKALEKEVNICLLDRSGSKIKMTSAGKLFYHEACRLVREHDRTMNTMAQYKAGISSSLKLGYYGYYMYPNHIVQWMLQSVGRFSSRHPEIEFAFLEGTDPEYTHGLVSHDVDLAVTIQGDMVDTDGIVHQTLLKNDVAVFVSKEHCFWDRDFITVHDLKGQKICISLMSGESIAAVQVKQWLVRNAVNEEDIVYCRTILETCLYAATGKYAAISGSASRISPLKSIRISDSTLEDGNIILAYRENTPFALEFADTVRQCIAEGASENHCTD